MSLVAQISAVVEAIGAAPKAKADVASLATVATSGSYSDLDDQPTIPPALPSQSGQAGKVLGTDGTVPSWVTPSGGGGGGIEFVTEPPDDGTPGVVYVDVVNGKFYQWEA